MHKVRRRYWIELGLAVVAGALTVLTLISRRWIEVVFGIDPDHGSGALEWGLVVVAASVAAVSALAARAERRRAVASEARA